MNILIPHSWLLEHLDTNCTPNDLQRMVSLCGPSIERIYEREGESVYDIEITTNRVDSMCVRGVAREAAVILTQFGVAATLKPTTISNLTDLKPNPAAVLPLPQITNNTPDCHRVLCVLLNNVVHTPTPDWMAKRLRQTDQQVHDSVIDITNYITHELGYPCHAFDYDKLMRLGGGISIVEAAPHLPFTTLDGVKRTTVGGEIVFMNPDGEIIDLPAVMGTSNSAVDATTTKVLLWIETLSAQKVRHASMSHAIRTTAAQLEEKSADTQQAGVVLARGVELYQSLCQATLASSVYDDYPRPTTPPQITTTLANFSRYLGLELPSQTIVQILEQLGCRVSITDSNLTVTPPSFRADLEIPVDLVEEVARIYGYQNLPSTIMAGALPLTKPSQVYFELEWQVKQYLAAANWQEVYTYSMVSEAEAVASGCSLADHLKIANPLTEDKVYLRRSLIPSLLQAATTLAPTHTEPIQIFELANTYQPQPKDLPQETMQLSLVLKGSIEQLKTHLRNLLHNFHVHLDLMPTITDRGVCFNGCIYLSQPTAGFVTATVAMHELGALAKSHPTYQPLPKYPAIVEDLTFTLPAKTPVGAVMTTLQAANPLVETVTFTNAYQHNYSYQITYRSSQQALSAADISPVRQALVTAVVTAHQGVLVGALPKTA